jgi:AhpC/TSA antioxidant enzyme
MIIAFSTLSMSMIAIATAAAAMVVPNRMMLSPSFLASLPDLYSTPMKLLSIDTVPVENNPLQVIVKENKDISTTFREAAAIHTKDASIVFVVRRPGCVLCREHGQQLTKWFDTQCDANKVSMWGIIKEIGVDDVGLSEFYHQYFTFPLYRDVNLALYQAFGNRRIGLSTWNPFKLYKGYQELTQRIAEKPGLAGNLKGEGMIQGGILILDKAGDVKYVYEEDIGNEFSLDDIQAALNDVLTKSSSNTQPTQHQGETVMASSTEL